MSINPRIFAFLALVGFFIFLAFGGNLIFPKKPVEENKTQMVIIEKTIEVLVTPTPDGHIYFASEYQNGTRLLKRPFSFIRYNALYKQDMKVTTIVYDYKFFEKLHWFNPTTYKYQEQLPQTPDNKFCFIFIYTFMDNELADDVRLWAFNRNAFAVLDEKTNSVYTYTTYPYQLRYKELENTPSFDNSVYVQAFKQNRLYSSSSAYVESGGEFSSEYMYLRGGKSNAIDGYLIYEVPKNMQPENTIVISNMYSFGFSNWRLMF